MLALDSITKFVPSPSELALVDRLLYTGGDEQLAEIREARAILQSSGLPLEDLDNIWKIANVEENTAIGKHCFAVAIRLVGHVQHGRNVSIELLSQGECCCILVENHHLKAT